MLKKLLFVVLTLVAFECKAPTFTFANNSSRVANFHAQGTQGSIGPLIKWDCECRTGDTQPGATGTCTIGGKCDKSCITSVDTSTGASHKTGITCGDQKYILNADNTISHDTATTRTYDFYNYGVNPINVQVMHLDTLFSKDCPNSPTVSVPAYNSVQFPNQPGKWSTTITAGASCACIGGFNVNNKFHGAAGCGNVTYTFDANGIPFPGKIVPAAKAATWHFYNYSRTAVPVKLQMSDGSDCTVTVPASTFGTMAQPANAANNTPALYNITNMGTASCTTKGTCSSFITVNNGQKNSSGILQLTKCGGGDISVHTEGNGVLGKENPSPTANPHSEEVVFGSDS